MIPGSALLLAASIGLSMSVPTASAQRPGRTYLMTATPIYVGLGTKGMCIAIDPQDSTGVWWWQSWRPTCATRSTGPGVFHAENGRVSTSPRSKVIGAHLRLDLIPRPGQRQQEHVDIDVAFEGNRVRSPATGATVAISRRNNLEIPQGW